MWDELEEAVAVLARELEKINEAWERMCGEISKLAIDAQETIDRRKEERERFGHPPKKLIVAYKEPLRRIRPCARSFGKRR